MLLEGLAAAAVATVSQGALDKAPPPPPPPPAVVSGHPLEVRVLQGDLVWIGGQRVRLAGIVAVDRAQRCGASGGFVSCGLTAVQTLTQAIGGRDVSCAILGEEATPFVRDPHILIGRCQAGGEDLAARVLSAGYALPLPGGGYQQQAFEACVAKRGLWAGYVESPLTFRRRRAGEPVTPKFIGARSGRGCLDAMSTAARS